MQQAAEAVKAVVRDNWRLIVIGLAVGATAFAGAYVISARSNGQAAASLPPPRSPAAGALRVPPRIESAGELVEASARFFGGETPTVGGYTDFVAFSEPDGAISVEVPAAWTATEVVPWLDERDERIGTSILSTPDASRFYRAWDAPGLFLGASRRIAAEGADSLLDRGRGFHAQWCLSAGRGDFNDGGYAGRYEAWYECDTATTVVVSAALHPPGSDAVIVAVYVKLVTAYDLVALERILESFRVDPAAVE